MEFLAFKTFDLVPKNAFNLVPNLKETFYLVVRSSAIRSSDHIPFYNISVDYKFTESFYLDEYYLP